MGQRIIAALLAGAGLLAAAPSAYATLAYVKGTNSSQPSVWAARDDGTHARKLGAGTAPAVSPDGRWVAWVDAAGGRVLLRNVKGHTARRIAHSSSIGMVAFSPDSSRLGAVLHGRLVSYDIKGRELDVISRSFVNGFSFSPDSKSLAYGTTGHNEAFDAPSDIYSVVLDTESKARVTRDRKSLNPLWGPNGDIIFDRQTPRQADAPKYNLYAIHPDGGAFRRITALKIPPLLSGLVPLDVSANGTRVLAEFVGQDTSVGFTVNPITGRTKSLSKDVETGFQASALSADGKTVLGMTGGADPGNRHDVVTMSYRGGKPKVLVPHAGYPAWSR